MHTRAVLSTLIAISSFSFAAPVTNSTATESQNKKRFDYSRFNFNFGPFATPLADNDAPVPDYGLHICAKGECALLNNPPSCAWVPSMRLKSGGRLLGQVDLVSTGAKIRCHLHQEMDWKCTGVTGMQQPYNPVQIFPSEAIAFDPEHYNIIKINCDKPKA
jgi:hypothetical protein